MSEDGDDLGYRNVLQLVRSLELLDELVIEAAQDALWYEEKHSDSIKLSAGREDLKRLQDTHGIYRDGHAMDDMLQHFSNLRVNQRLFDTLIASVIRVMDRTVGSERGQWLDWYERLQKAGDASWRNAVPASKSMGNADMINALTDKYASIDRVLDVLKGYLLIPGERAKFSDDYRDTLFAIISISQARGPYAPLNMDEINIVKSEIRRRRQIEQRDFNTDPIAAQSVRPYVEEDDSQAQPTTNPPEPAAQTSQKWNSTVTATVAILFAVILAAIPGYKAWQYSPREPGTIFDADFWFLVQSCMMQMIGLLTIVLPLALSGRLAFQQWFWTWSLFGVSLSCSIAPIPIYLYFPTEWSATIAFLGSAAQAFVTLQALFVVHKEKTL